MSSSAAVSAFQPCSCPIKARVWALLRSQAEEMIAREPCVGALVNNSILIHNTFAEALCWRLSTKLAGKFLSTEFYQNVFLECIGLSRTEGPLVGEGDVERLAIEDLVAAEHRDPACRSILDVFLFMKGYKSLQCYRLAHVLWTRGRRDLALVIQARTTEVFGVDIHPAARIGGGLMIDHGTGVVIGETTVVGRNCTFLHGVTLGSTGKPNSGHDRHPKLGDSVFLGAQTTVLGNISIGDHCVVGSCSLVLRPLPAGSTAVGSPAMVKSINSSFSAGPPTPNPSSLDLTLAIPSPPESPSRSPLSRASFLSPPTVDEEDEIDETDPDRQIELWAGAYWKPKLMLP